MIEPTQQRTQDKDQRTNPKYFDFPTAIANFTKQQQTRTDNHQINGHYPFRLIHWYAHII